MAHPRIVTLLAMALVGLASSSSICYSPDGVQSHQIPCSPGKTFSSCCEVGWVCYSNGLCGPGPDINSTNLFTKFYIGDCTDSLWKGQGCVSNCLNSTGNGLNGCGNVGPGNFCCYGLSDSQCCSNSSKVFYLGAANVVTTISPVSSSTISTSSSTSSTPAIAVTSSLSTSTTTTPSATASSSITSGSNSVAIGVGAGVGIPVGLAIIVGLYYFLLLRPKRKQPRERDYALTELDAANEKKMVNRGMSRTRPKHELPASGDSGMPGGGLGSFKKPDPGVARGYELPPRETGRLQAPPVELS